MATDGISALKLSSPKSFRLDKSDPADKTQPAAPPLFYRALIELIDISFDARGLSKQRLLIHDARVRIDRRTLRLGVGRRGNRDDAGDRNHAKDAACSRTRLFTRYAPGSGSAARWIASSIPPPCVG